MIWMISLLLKPTAPLPKSAVFMEMFVTPKIGSPPLYLATSELGKTQEAEKNERLREVIATLERCRADLVDGSDRETIYILDILVLQLQTRIHRIGEAELQGFCAALEPGFQAQPDVPRTRRGGGNL